MNEIYQLKAHHPSISDIMGRAWGWVDSPPCYYEKEILSVFDLAV